MKGVVIFERSTIMLVKQAVLAIVAICGIVLGGGVQAAETPHWYPFMADHPRTIEEYIHDLQSGNARVACSTVISRLNRQGFSFSSCDDFVSTLRTEGELRPCGFTRANIPPGFGIEYTNSSGTVFGSSDRSTRENICYPGESFIWLRRKPIISTYCGNVVQWPAQPVAVVPRTVWVEDPPIVKYESGGIGVSVGVGSPYYGGGVHTGISLDYGDTSTQRSGHLVTEYPTKEEMPQ